ncbi:MULTISPECIES: RNA polymerase sigma factor [Mesoflavibacter]|jgi:RNA polymerase sigma-70 factor (ECF subfamily)|uniref:RNA polymerase sigma factor n=1 Tax=Mesoflavibacter zeaxanthinifaciens subsp. sabulilitoris TaxID=1520893 RepID=A0A2T1NKQ3_9FLAO|nr:MULTISPECIES: RNA polymerase sigma factor [Mesoflavibacter]MBB3122553.1 RNA polymerase sigma-70 factor (ECF subfamily) [Mesoflavibacter zeaxanthinifaciens subsp. sabulilitoris]PSG93488.1 RNA polymerase sigma factor [Mesoflavibacter zeaxanthinifaciens subsp. sabulilitoris]UAB75539.1 RNA polymerase sigma factor [Mesoflavibacter sp. SCSIO 43206]
MQLEYLVSQFQKKDEKAFEKLYNMYSQSMHGVIYNIVRDNEIAEEVMQDVFIKAWEKADSYNSSKGRFFTWLLNISRNAAIDKTRSKAFKKSSKNLNSDYFVDIIHSSDNLGSKTDAIGIKKFVDKLAEKCVKIIELLYFKGYTQKEASEELDMPIGTIKTRNRNCIQELRDSVL